MAYNPESPFAVPGFALEPLLLEDVGDPAAGPSANLKQAFDVLRRFRGYQTTNAARNALADPQPGDFVLMLASGARLRVDVYYTGNGWTPWGDTPAGAHTRLTPLVENPTGSGRYDLFGSGLHERVFVERIPQFEGVERDYTVDTATTPWQVVFNEGKKPLEGRTVFGAVAQPDLTSTNADTLLGALPDKGQLGGGVVVRQANGTIEGVGGSNANSLDGYDSLVSPGHAPNKIPVHDDDGNLDATTLGGFAPSGGNVGSRVVVRGADGSIAGYGGTGGVNGDTLDGFDTVVSPSHAADKVPVHDELGGLDATTLEGAAASTAATADAIAKRDGSGAIAGASSDKDTVDGYTTAVSPTHTADTIPVHDADGNLDATTLGGAAPDTAAIAGAIVKRNPDGTITGLSSDKDTVDGYTTAVSPTHTASTIPVHSATGGLDATTLGGAAPSAVVAGNTIVKRDGSGGIAGVSSDAATLDTFDTVVSPTHTASRIPVHDADGNLDATTLGGAAPATAATANAIVKRNADGTITGAVLTTVDGYNTVVSPTHTANKIPVHSAAGALDATTLMGALPATSGPDTILKRKADGTIEGITASPGKLELVYYGYMAADKQIAASGTTGFLCNTEVVDTLGLTWTTSGGKYYFTMPSGSTGEYLVVFGHAMNAMSSGVITIGMGFTEFDTGMGDYDPANDRVIGHYSSSRADAWTLRFIQCHRVKLTAGERWGVFNANITGITRGISVKWLAGQNNTFIRIYRIL
jgi:hypothetical protein